MAIVKSKNVKGDPLNTRVATKPIHVSSAIHKRAKELAARTGISLGQYAENALLHLLEFGQMRFSGWRLKGRNTGLTAQTRRESRQPGKLSPRRSRPVADEIEPR